LSISPIIYLTKDVDAGTLKASRFVLLIISVERGVDSVWETVERAIYA
jgi:hypothetical protein